MIRIGTSGWVYPHWRRVFYPVDLPQNKWFDHYSKHFDTVEINNSFYRIPTDATFDRWCEQAPTGFCYAIKASRYITHMKKLKDPTDSLEMLFDGADRLASKLGPVLYQLPPRWPVDLGRFELFLDALPSGYKHVVEFRESSWLIEDVFRLMRSRRVAHCIHDYGGLQIPPEVTGRLVYLRFHGGAGHRGNYSKAKLKSWAQRIGQWRRKKLSVFAYFNNDVGGYAIKNALTLKRMLEGVLRSSEF